MASAARRSNNPESILHLRNTVQKDLPLQFLRDITEEFSDDRVLGKGAFGVVYKGTLQSGEEIAVKKLSETEGRSEKLFKNEVCNLMTIKHENVVELIGYCDEVQRKFVKKDGEYIREDTVEMLLCYEYISKGSLDRHIFGQTSEVDWNKRFKMIKGICQGLHFLHKELETPIIHMDLKPDNILLDDNMVPKIADFGLSRLFGKKQTRVCTSNLLGSIGYMAPEYLFDGVISTQSDIYSLGILIMEITTGERNIKRREDMSSKQFIENVRANWTNRSFISSKYRSLDKNSINQVEKCIEIGLKSVNTKRKERPSIEEIVDMLN